MPKTRRPIRFSTTAGTCPLNGTAARDLTITERLACIEAARDAERDLERLADEIALLEAWLADPTYTRMTSSLHAGINRRRDRRIELLSAPLPVPTS